jgi:hypothetical protein
MEMIIGYYLLYTLEALNQIYIMFKKVSSEEGNLMTHVTSPAIVEKYLKGVNYPASKQDLIEKAEENNAPEDVLLTLEALEEEEFNSPVDVSKAFGEIE